MECPQCKTELVMAERQGVEIDHCPKCRGVWLDRGELDKIVERSHAYAAADGRGDAEGYAREDDVRDSPHGGEYRQPRRKSFWSELFD